LPFYSLGKWPKFMNCTRGADKAESLRIRVVERLFLFQCFDASYRLNFYVEIIDKEIPIKQIEQEILLCNALTFESERFILYSNNVLFDVRDKIKE
jgi:hypothetical protein